ncbi:MAG TPA: hypothetical protein VGR57_11155, partial [Ktedonobacterales bacterium]|nr:hypothetical protein [Ktedonobacterales bacterium]
MPATTAPTAGAAVPPAQPAYTYPPQYGYPPAAYPRQYGYPGYTPYYYPAYGYPYPYPYPPRPRPAKGERYRAVLGWIVTIGSGLLLLGGLGLLGLLLLDTAIGAHFSLASVAGTVGLIVAAALGGGGGLYLGITALLKRPSVRLSLPPAWVWLTATVVVIGGEIVIWNAQPAPGSLFAILPLFMLAGALPAGTILAYAARRLGFPTTWRHMLVSLIYGAVVATLLASIIEGLLFIALVIVLARFGVDVTFGENFLQNFDPSN